MIRIFNIVLFFTVITVQGQKNNYFDRFITDTLFKTAHLGVSVFDPLTQKHIHSYQGDKYFVPASNIKIITAYAALKYLPDTLSVLAEDLHWKEMGPGWAWDDDQELENPFPVIPYFDCGEIWSGSLDSLLKPMMFDSDNFLAEQLWRTIKKQTSLDSFFYALPRQPSWVDGCGLSRYNLFTPQQFTYVLNKLFTEEGEKRIKTIFPTGNKGTLRNYYIKEQGIIYAKTGTLTGVVALSGYLFTKNKKTLIFSVLVNNHTSKASVIRRRIERFIKQLSVSY